VEAVVARQWYGKHVTIAADTETTVKVAVLSVWSKSRLYNEDQ
jgi:hypothetical protein